MRKLTFILELVIITCAIANARYL